MPNHAVHRLLRPLLVWRARHVSERMYMLVLSVLVGLGAGLAAVLLKTAIRAQQNMLQGAISEPQRVFALSVYPIIGITLTVLVTKYLLGGQLGRGIGPIIYSTARENSVVPRSKLYSQLITAFLTVSFGGSAGTEAPISVTGAAMGSNMAGCCTWTGGGGACSRGAARRPAWPPSLTRPLRGCCSPSKPS